MSERNIGLIGYEHPSHRDSWQLVFDNADQVAFVVINVDSGVGDDLDAEYVWLRGVLRSLGIPVFGYVKTATDGPIDPATGRPIRIYGTRALDAIGREIELWKSRYEINSVFFDEVSSSGKLHYYTRAVSIARTIIPNSTVILNCGTLPPNSELSILKAILCTFESNQENYLSETFPDWERATQSFHIIYGVTNATAVFAAVVRNRAGYYYLTSVPGPDPEYDVASTIFPTKSPAPITPTPTTPPTPTPVTENEATKILIETANIIGGVGTLKDVPDRAREVMTQLNYLRVKSEGALADVKSKDLIDELSRRLLEE